MGKQNLIISVQDSWKKGDFDYNSFIKALVHVFDDWLEGERAGVRDDGGVSKESLPESK